MVNMGLLVQANEGDAAAFVSSLWATAHPSVQVFLTELIPRPVLLFFTELVLLN
jgi:hypothetical protein